MPKSRCCIPTCTTREGDKGIPFHGIPAKPERRSEWVKIIQRVRQDDNWTPCKSTVVCGKHFEVSCYRTDPSYVCQELRHLKAQSVPTLFDKIPKGKEHTMPEVAEEALRLSNEKNETETIIPDLIYPFNVGSESSSTDQGEEPKLVIRRPLITYPGKVGLKTRRVAALGNELTVSDTATQDFWLQVQKIKKDADSGESQALLLVESILKYGKRSD